MFNLTREEQQVLLFLIAVTSVGAGINFLVNRYLPVKTLAGFSQDFGKIDLNSADKDMLMSVPGIGEKLAQHIIEYRDKQTTFGELEELKNIKGITESRYEKMKDYLIVR